MEPLTILRADPLDLLFENRNKDYGAYPLRKYYAQRLMISLGIVISILFILTFLYFRFRDPSIVRNIPYCPIVILEPFNPVRFIKPVNPPAKPSAPKPPATVEFKTPVIVKDPVVTTLASVEDIGTHAIGLETVSGKEQENQQPSKESGAANITKTGDSLEVSSEIFDRPEQMPEFPGGQEALKRFLQKNLYMPENNLEAGTQVKIIARFVVGNDGRVRDVEITQGSDGVFNQEVRRVILKMPDWKPGMQHNRNVAVYFSLPVNFMAEE